MASEFDVHSIICAARLRDLNESDLASHYKFYCNVYLEDNLIKWTHALGGSSNGGLDRFLQILRVDNNYAFGPCQKQKGWSLVRLSDLNAIGVYKLDDYQ